MAKYYVYGNAWASFLREVEAGSEEEALEIANEDRDWSPFSEQALSDVDFGKITFDEAEVAEIPISVR